MTPVIHTTITYGIDTGAIYFLLALGWMGMMAMMLYSEKPSGCTDEEKLAKLIEEQFNQQNKDKAREQRLEKTVEECEETKKWRRVAELDPKEYVTDPDLKEWSDFVEDINMDYTLHELVSADHFAENMDALLPHQLNI
jgi:hypothetical protein